MLLVACERDGIRAYRAPKPPPKASTPIAPAITEQAPAPTPPAASSDKRVTWALPVGWKEIPSTQQMRIATIDAGGLAEVAITAFPGSAGGNLANVNRWRGQMGQPPLDEAGLAATGILKTVIVGERTRPVEVTTLSIAGAGDNKDVMLGAIITPGDGQTWFVKCTTSASKADSLRTAFEALAHSFRLEGDAATTTTPPSVSRATAPAPTGDSVAARLTSWKAPAHWAAEAAGNAFVAAGFVATNSHGSARITATSLQGDGGGLLANINRWREQVGLAPVADISQQEQSAALGPGTTLVDLAKPDGTDRMLAAIVPANGATWFFKLRGASEAVEAERAAFEAFVKEVGVGQGPGSTAPSAGGGGR